MQIFHKAFGVLQQIGKSLMLPVAVLPAAGILLAVGAAEFSIVPPIVSNLMESAGGAVFGNLPIIFAIGVSLGLTKNDGVSALAAVVFYGVLLASMGVAANAMGYETKSILGIESIDTGVFGGILSGVFAASIFNRYFRIQLPDYLGFFGGKRFVPIASAFVAIVVGVVMSFVWPPIGAAIDAFSDWAANGNPLVAFGLYGFVERLLIPFGLHHIWNYPFFFEVGTYVNPETGETIRGEIQRFAQGDKTAGALAGGYLFKMWGLPAAALAIWHTAKPENRAKVGGIMISGALTSFLTGITEPIEFAFMFVAPLLYVIHAVLASAAFVLAISFGIKHGTTFSHGLIDYTTLFAQSTNAGWLLVIGPLWAAMYYLIFRVAIQKFDLQTPGREESTAATGTNEVEGLMAHQLVLALGGRKNIQVLDACITRLRVTVESIARVNQEQLKTLGASGVLVVGNNLQAIFGPASENLKTDIELYLETAGDEADLPASEVDAAVEPPAAAPPEEAARPLDKDAVARLKKVVAGLGGTSNIAGVNHLAHTRIRVELRDGAAIDEQALGAGGVRGVMQLADNVVHLILGSESRDVANALHNGVTGGIDFLQDDELLTTALASAQLA